LGIFRREADDQPRNSSNSGGIRASSSGARPIRPPQPTQYIDSFGLASAQPVAYNAPRALTAAAVQIKMNDKGEAALFKSRRQSSSSAWQKEAWEYYDAIGEIKYAFNLVASVVSRIRMYVASVDDPAEAPVPVAKSSIIDERLAAAAARALDRLDSAYGGQAGLLKDAALNFRLLASAT
jgi:hypothetical protein